MSCGLAGGSGLSAWMALGGQESRTKGTTVVWTDVIDYQAAPDTHPSSLTCSPMRIVCNNNSNDDGDGDSRPVARLKEGYVLECTQRSYRGVPVALSICMYVHHGASRPRPRLRLG